MVRLTHILGLLVLALALLPLRAGAQAQVVPATLGEARLELEMASTPALRYLGLSGRPGLPPGRGMAFGYPYPGRWRMVMRDMLFGLDFIWVAEGKVVGVTANVPPPKAGQNPIEVGPPQDIDMVLELPAGWAAAHGVGVGARLTLLGNP